METNDYNHAMNGCRWALVAFVVWIAALMVFAFLAFRVGEPWPWVAIVTLSLPAIWFVAEVWRRAWIRAGMKPEDAYKRPQSHW